MIQLIITADDFGVHPKVDEAIITLAQKGLVTAVSACMNMPHAVEKVKYLKAQAPNVAVGVHLTFSAGYPTLDTPEVKKALTHPGTDHFQTTKDFYFDRLANGLPAVWAEANEQIRLLREEVGIEPDHINCHEGILQLLPDLHALYQELSEVHDIPMRNPIPAGSTKQQPQFHPIGFLWSGLKRGWQLFWQNKPKYKLLLFRSAAMPGRTFCKRMVGFNNMPDYFVDNFYGRVRPMKFTKIIDELSGPFGHKDTISYEMVTHLSTTATIPDLAAGPPYGRQGGVWAGYAAEADAPLPVGINPEYFPGRKREYDELMEFADQFHAPDALRGYFQTRGMALACYRDVNYDLPRETCYTVYPSAKVGKHANVNHYHGFPVPTGMVS